MQIRAVGHVCLDIETKGLRLLTNPWWEGPAFTGQWHAWPRPVAEGLKGRRVDYVFFSNRRDDHFHLPSLQTLEPGATALVPGLVSDTLTERLQELGFCQVIELPHGEPVPLRRGVTATCWIHQTDAVLVLDDGDRVAALASDGLHTAPTLVLDHLCRALLRRHPGIDTLFLGYGGPSWFPNGLLVPGKSDLAVARQRAAFLLDRFVRVASALRPRVACAYGSGFSLLDPCLRWLNEVRFDLPGPDELFQKRQGRLGSRAHLLLPGDLIDDLDLVPGPTARPSREGLREAIGKADLAQAARDAERPRPLDHSHWKSLSRRLDAQLRTHSLRETIRSPFKIDLRLKELPDAVLHVNAGRGFAEVAEGPAKQGLGQIELRAEILEALLASPDGIHSILLGHGATARLGRLDHHRQVLDLLRLASPRSAGWRQLASEARRRPLTTGRHLWKQRWPLALSACARSRLLESPFEVRLPEDERPPLRDVA